jgi:cysteine-rich repeat protein
MFKFRTGQAYKGSGIADLPGSSPASGADPQAGSRGPGRVRTRIPDTQQCDDGNAANGDGCSSTCQINPGFNCVGSPSVCSTICGHGIVAGNESCDDGNAVTGDGCSGMCAVEFGYMCTGSPSVCIHIP